MNRATVSGPAIIAAPCKVNLTLDVFAPRQDGFHDLDSVVAVVRQPADELVVEARPAERAAIQFECSDPSLPTDDRNLAFRAARRFAETFLDRNPHAIRVSLDKRLPHQAGLGGGSSDAAAVLEHLGRRFGAPRSELLPLAAELGSDVPLFLADASFVRMQGRGERVEPVGRAMPSLFGVVVKPEAGVPTGPAFALLDALPDRRPGSATPRFLDLLPTFTDAPDSLEYAADIAAIGAALHNDFEAAVLPHFPEVARAHETVAGEGAVRALLCGSGAAVFGLARDADHAWEMEQSLRGRFSYVSSVLIAADSTGRSTERRNVR